MMVSLPISNQGVPLPIELKQGHGSVGRKNGIRWVQFHSTSVTLHCHFILSFLEELIPLTVIITVIIIISTPIEHKSLSLILPSPSQASFKNYWTFPPSLTYWNPLSLPLEHPSLPRTPSPSSLHPPSTFSFSTLALCLLCSSSSSSSELSLEDKLWTS